jgi:transposase
MIKHKVKLLPDEKKKLKAMISVGQNKAVVIRRAHILLKTDEGKTDAEISDMLYVSEQTIRRTRLRYVTEGLQVALEDKPHPKPAPKLNEKQEAHLVAVTCSEPPTG